MPNRILKESICTSDTIEQLKPEEEVFFYRLLVVCDDYGRMDARPAILRAKCFPLKVDKINEDDIKSWLKKLCDVGLLYIYTVDNKQYLYITTWCKHQQVRASKSKYPAPDDANETDDITHNQVISDDSKCPRNRNTIYDNRNTIHDIRINTPSQNDDIAESDTQPTESNISTPKKNKYAEFVSMTEDEYKKLVANYKDEALVKRMIEVLDNYKGANGKKYKSDYRAILNWVAEKVLKENKTDNQAVMAAFDYEAASKSKYGW